MISDYDQFHQNPTNLALHIVAVPLFVLCFLGAVWSLLTGNILVAVIWFTGPVLSLAIQGMGHKLEPIPPEPFTGPGNFLRRILMEQFLGFWVFVFSGGWYRALKNSEKEDSGV
jgi:hypothetical protein